MKLKAVYDKQEDIPEGFAALYTQRGDKWELTEIEGVRTQGDVDRLQTSLTAERNDHKQTKKRFELLGDRKIEDILAELDKIPELEARAGQVDDKKIDQIVESRVRTKVAPIERELTTAKARLTELETENTGFKTERTQRTIADNVRDVIGKQQGFQSSAIDDAIMYGERHLEVNAEGRVVTRDGVGVTPGVDAAVWLSEMQNKKAHWWGTTQGAGARGSNGGNNGGANPFSHEGWNMTEQGKILTENADRAHQLARSAGTTVGGGRPAPKK